MTLSNSKVQRALGRDFVCAWMDTDGDPVAGASFAHDPGDPPPTCIRGNGEHNLQLLFLTPQGQVVSVLAGYLTPDDMLEEIELVLSTLKKLEKIAEEGDEAEAERAKVVEEAHRAHLAALEEREFDGPLGDWERRRALADHRFMAKNPLMPASSFRTERLVGNSRTFFGSYTGDKPRGELGERPELDVDELLRRVRGDKD